MEALRGAGRVRSLLTPAHRDVVGASGEHCPAACLYALRRYAQWDAPQREPGRLQGESTQRAHAGYADALVTPPAVSVVALNARVGLDTMVAPICEVTPATVLVMLSTRLSAASQRSGICAGFR